MGFWWFLAVKVLYVVGWSNKWCLLAWCLDDLCFYGHGWSTNLSPKTGIISIPTWLRTVFWDDLTQPRRDILGGVTFGPNQAATNFWSPLTWWKQNWWISNSSSWLVFGFNNLQSFSLQFLYGLQVTILNHLLCVHTHFHKPCYFWYGDGPKSKNTFIGWHGLKKERYSRPTCQMCQMKVTVDHEDARREPLLGGRPSTFGGVGQCQACTLHRVGAWANFQADFKMFRRRPMRKNVMSNMLLIASITVA